MPVLYIYVVCNNQKDPTMNIPSPFVTLIIVLIISLIQIKGCKAEISDQEYLQSVYEELDKIKSATYYITGSASAPGDTISFSEPRHLYIKEFVNPEDEFVLSQRI